jgi:hypothetical protein
MTITHNSDYSVITITSTNLSDFSLLSSVTLSATINCSTTEYTDTIVEGDVTTNSFNVDISTMFGTDTLEDSVYEFVLTINKNDSTTVKEYGCLFVDNETKCKVAECVKDKQNLELQLDYYILSRASGCSCACSDMCKIYNRLKNELTCC